jgi:hypothetical protein
MAEATKQGNDQGIGEGNLREERGAPPYADRAYAGESEPAGETGTSLEGGRHQRLVTRRGRRQQQGRGQRRRLRRTGLQLKIEPSRLLFARGEKRVAVEH